MASNRNLMIQTSQVFAVKILGAVFSLIAASLIARVLQPERFGEYAFIMSIVSIASIPSTIGLRQVVTREVAYRVARNGVEEIGEIIKSALLIALIGVLVTAPFLLAGPALITEISGLQKPLFLGALLLFLLPLPQILSGALHGLGKVVASQLPKFVVHPLLMIALISSVLLFSEKAELPVMLIMMFFAAALVAEGLLAGLVLTKTLAPMPMVSSSSNSEKQRKILMMSAMSFGAIAAAQLIMNNVDILILGLLETKQATGIYKASFILSALVSFGLVATNAVIMPKIAALYASGNQVELQRLVTRSAVLITSLAFCGAAFILMFGEYCLIFVFGETYSQGYTTLVILSVGQLFNALFGPVALILNMTGNERTTLIGVTIAVVANSTLNLTLIPYFGIEGAAIATATSLFLWNMILAIALVRLTGINATLLIKFWKR